MSILEKLKGKSFDDVRDVLISKKSCQYNVIYALEHKYNPLLVAVFEKYLNSKYLDVEDLCCNINSDYFDEFNYYLKRTSIENIKYLLDSKILKPRQIDDILLYNIINNNFDIVNLLFDKRRDEIQPVLLETVIFNNNSDLVKLFLDNKLYDNIFVKFLKTANRYNNCSNEIVDLFFNRFMISDKLFFELIDDAHLKNNDNRLTYLYNKI